jgi:hypothetical protein
MMSATAPCGGSGCGASTEPRSADVAAVAMKPMERLAMKNLVLTKNSCCHTRHQLSEIWLTRGIFLQPSREKQASPPAFKVLVRSEAYLINGAMPSIAFFASLYPDFKVVIQTAHPIWWLKRSLHGRNGASFASDVRLVP